MKVCGGAAFRAGEQVQSPPCLRKTKGFVWLVELVRGRLLAGEVREVEGAPHHIGRPFLVGTLRTLAFILREVGSHRRVWLEERQDLISILQGTLVENGEGEHGQRQDTS